MIDLLEESQKIWLRKAKVIQDRAIEELIMGCGKKKGRGKGRKGK